MRSLVLFLVLGANMVVSQKLVQKTIVDPDVRLIQIDVMTCFDLQIESSRSEEMKVEAVIDGEYKDDLTLNLEREGGTILVSTAFTPHFKAPNDKLGMHKLLSIQLLVTVPDNQNVQVNGAGCNVFATGVYDSLNVVLNDGNCTLREVSKMTQVRTHSGNIDVYSTGANVRASSKYGKVAPNGIPWADNDFHLTTATGNVNLTFTGEVNNN